LGWEITANDSISTTTEINMRKFLLASVAIIGLSSPAFAASSLSIGGGFNLGNTNTVVGTVTHGLAAAGSVGAASNQSIGAGFATTTPAGNLTAGVGATTGQSNSISGAGAAFGGSAATFSNANNFGVGVGGGFTNTTP
jgi:hypothetical protein